jgi:hemoglobin-like flavoprotein
LTLKYVKNNFDQSALLIRATVGSGEKGESNMTSEQTTLVQTSFAKVAPIADTAATLFYDRLFELNPSLRGLFNEDLREQRVKLMAMLTNAVNNLHDWGALAPHVRRLGLRHVGYGVKPSDYDTVGTALIDTLQKGLGEAFTSPVRDAWIACYTMIAAEMQAAEQAEALQA